MQNIRLNKCFFLRLANQQEMYDIILNLDLTKSIGPNSIPVHILKICNESISHSLMKMINLSLITGIFPELCKTAKVHKKDDPFGL